MSKISIVVPCYNEEQSVPRFYDAILPVLDSLEMEWEILFVNDGSRDKTAEVLSALAARDERVKVYRFSRNFGQQAAILCGYEHGTGDCFMELDCDLQDPVSAIPEMVARWREGYEVVHGRRRRRRGETWFKKMTANLYYRFLARISETAMPRDTGDFKLLDRRAVRAIVSMPERHKYLRGAAAWVGFRQTFVDFDRDERVAGETKYTLKKMIRLASDGILSNSKWPLTLAMKGGIFLLIASLLAFIAMAVFSLVRTALPLTAWLFPTGTLLTSFLLLSHGMSNLYLARIYEEAKARPDYIVAETLNVPSAEQTEE